MPRRGGAVHGGDMSFVGELRRRNVVRVAIVYGVASWLLLQIADVARSLLRLPDWSGGLVILLLALGLPVALVISWVYEITPEGLARTKAVDPAHSIAPQTARRLDRIIMAGLALSVIVLLADRFLSHDAPRPRPAAAIPAQPAASLERLRTIAVLPFVNMSNDPANEYFSDGMSEEILDTLARIEGLQVAARTASFQFKGRGADIAEIGQKLNVGAILEGSVRRAGESVRISAQLVDVTNGYRIWSRTFDRSATDVFAVQTDIAGEIADALQLEIGATDVGPAPERLRQLPSDDPRAYELFLQGRHLWRQRNGPAIGRAVDLLEEAVRRDPQFAEAHAALASAYTVQQNYSSVDAATARSHALAAADRALALDSSLSEAIAVQAMAFRDTHQWQAAEQGLRRAIELEPNEATPHHWLALMHLSTGYLREFSTEIARAYALDPTNAAIAGLMTIERHFAGDTAGAVRQAELAASMGGVFALVCRLPEVLYDAGQSEAALEATRRGFAQIGLDAALADTIHSAVLDPARRSAARQAILSAPRRFYAANMRICGLMRIGEVEAAVHEALEAGCESDRPVVRGVVQILCGPAGGAGVPAVRTRSGARGLLARAWLAGSLSSAWR
jgi:TolB-like protein